MKIIYGNVTKTKHRPVIIPHIVNDCGVLNSGVAIALANKWPVVKSYYQEWHRSTMLDSWNYIDVKSLPDYIETENVQEIFFKLGQIQTIRVDNGVFVCNMVAQAQPGGETIAGRYLPPIRYQSLEECMLRVLEFARLYKEKFNADLKINAPWFGTLRAGGTKEKIQEMINDVWSDLNVTIFEYEETK